MHVTKKVISNLNKCYAMSEVTVEGKHCFVVAAEKHDPCYLFSEEGELLEKVWDEPGGVMTMAPVPGADGQFLAIHKFYSPNDSADAKIVIVTRRGKGDWEARTLCEAPFVHRFGIFRRAGVNYLLVCCLKSGHSYKNDWRFAGACFAAELPDDLSEFNDGHLLELSLVQDGMLRNHGFSRAVWGGHEAAVIGCEQGTFLMEPPRVRGTEWTVTNILPVPSSDAVLIDFDGDGKLELGLISPFHGNSLTIWHLNEFGYYVPQWKYGAPEKETEMLHATWADMVLGKPTWIVGWRKGTKCSIAITWNAEAGDYRAETFDSNTGMANAMHFVRSDGKEIVVGTNREIDEVAYYEFAE